MAEAVYSSSSVPDQHPASTLVSQTRNPSCTPSLPRVTIRFCTQCKWMLRAAYFAQELLSTFSTSLGEVALQPATGGVFVVEIYSTETTPTTTEPEPEPSSGPSPTIRSRVLWDRKVDGGFPETKELKRRVRDVRYVLKKTELEPNRNLGHVDRDYPRQQPLEKEEGNREPNTSSKDKMPEVEQQQQRQQPPGPRWPQLKTTGPSQVIAQGQQTITDDQSKPSTNTTAKPESQSKTPRDLGPHPQQEATDVDGPIYDPRMPGGGIMPKIPPAPLRPGSSIQEAPLQTQSQSQESQRECEDCQ